MIKLYVLVLSSAYNKDEVSKFLDTKPEINFWFSSLPSSIFIKTEISSRAISELIREQFGVELHFITEVSPNYWGSLSKDLWKNFPPVNHS